MEAKRKGKLADRRQNRLSGLRDPAKKALDGGPKLVIPD
jgi:hypothetical protein